MQKLLGVLLCCAVSVGYASEKPVSQKIEISEKCHQDWQNISKDAAYLKYYFKGVFKSLADQNNADYKPSGIIKWCRDEDAQNINKRVECDYKPASWYMINFITNEKCELLDKIFVEKYNETNDVSGSLKSTYKYFCENILKKPLGDFCNDMIQRDAARIRLAKQGVLIDGRTMILDGNRMSENPEDMKQINEDFKILYKK